MERRTFLTLLGGGAAVLPLAARAQQAGKLPTIGFIGATTRPTIEDYVAAFVQRLHELGWIEGRTVAIAYRWGDGRAERMAETAAELVRLKVDVIVTQGNIATAAAKQATSTIPIVFGVAGDPVGTGLVASLARPGGNVTGLSLQQPDTSAKRLELLRDVVPKLHKVAILTNADNPVNMRELPDVEAAARKLGLELSIVEIRHGADIAPAFGKIAGSADAVYVLGDTVLFANRTGISTLAASAKLPTISNQPLYATAGGLLSYGPNSADLYRRAAEFVDKILRGAKPADLPVEQPTKFDLVVNQTTAKAIGLKIPESILIRADQVIE